MRPPALNTLPRRAGLTGLSARDAVVAKPGGWKPRPGPTSAPAAVARPRSPPEPSCITPSCRCLPGSGRLYLMATHSNGISALQLQRQLAFGSYKTAWLICAKLRCSMLAPGRSPLAGLVEVDETEIACRSKNDPVTGGGGRSHQGKMLVVGAVEVEDSGLGPGRIRLSQVPDYSAASLHAFLAANLGPGATAKTDGWSGYP